MRKFLAAFLFCCLTAMTPAQRVILFSGSQFTYYINSQTGNNNNSGRSALSPWADFTWLNSHTPPAGASIGIAAGSYIRPNGLSITQNNITVAAYGNGPRPVIDGGAIISPSCWTLVSGNTYTTGTNCPSLVGPGGSDIFISLYECQSSPCTPTGAGGNDTTLQNETSLANTEAQAGSYYISNMSGSTLVIDYQATDGSNPATNGYQVTYSLGGGIFIDGAHATLKNLILRKSPSNGGPCGAGESYDGGAPTYINVDCDQGNKHNLTSPSGGTFINVRFHDEYCPTNVCGGTGNMAVIFDQTTHALPTTFNDPFFYQSVGYSGSTITATYSHTGDSGTMGAVTVSGGEAKAIGSGQLQGLAFNLVASVTASNFVCNQLTQCTAFNESSTLNNIQAVSTVTNNQQFSLGGSSATLNNVSACVANEAKGVVLFSNGALTLNGFSSYIQSPSASTAATVTDNGGGNMTLTVNNSNFDSAVNFAHVYALTGSGGTFAGGASAGTANNYGSSPNYYVNRWQINNTTYSTLATWQAAVTPADSFAGTNAGSAINACTLPPWASNDNFTPLLKDAG